MRLWQIILLHSTKFFIVVLTSEININHPIPYYARQVEGDVDDKIEENQEVPKNNLVSLLVNNLQEIFSGNEDAEPCTPITKTGVAVSKTDDQTVERRPYSVIEEPKLLDDERYVNMSKMSMIDAISDESIPTISKLEMDRVHMSQFRKEIALKKSQQKLIHENSDNFSNSNKIGRHRSCVFCDNVKFEDCSNPKKKLIPSVICKNETDVCYSQHTPFGIVDRGCYNSENHLITYVCSCNLCNYIPLWEMPYSFRDKHEWVQNVVEISRLRNLRKSVFKKMACLRCEVKEGKTKENSDQDEFCLNGNLGSVPTQICSDGEICAIKAIKSKNFIWRGCVRAPLYNYWRYLCNTDLCNYDTLVSVFDFYDKV